MTGGKYDGYQMKDIPQDYYLYIYKEKKCNWKVRQYIEKYHEELIKKGG